MGKGSSQWNDKKLGIFGGTSEGRLLAEFCQQKGIPALVSVATPYGSQMLKQDEFLQVRQGRMDSREMCRWMKDNGFACVVDATHPYAREASENIRHACREAQIPYHRLVRSQDTEECQAEAEGRRRIKWVGSAEEAACFLEQEFLQNPERTALITTGSKELNRFASIQQAGERLYARVLPSAEGIQACLDAGLKGKHVIAMQGPFSYEMNLAMLRSTGASYLITKESGRAGGFQEKVEAALDAGCQPVVIGRPVEEQGKSLPEMESWLEEMFWKTQQEEAGEGKDPEAGTVLEPGTVLERGTILEPGNGLEAGTVLEEENDLEGREITLIGIGMGSLGQMTLDGIQALWNSDAILGASRMVESGLEMVKQLTAMGLFEKEGRKTDEKKAARKLCITYRPEEMIDWLDQHPRIRKPVVLYSGDTGFFSGAEGLARIAAKSPGRYTCRILPGISSMAYFAARLGRSWEKAAVVSLHGRADDAGWDLSDGRERFLLLDGPQKLQAVCRRLVSSGQSEARIWIGERLSYEEERIISGTAKELENAEFDRLAVAWIVPA